MLFRFLRDMGALCHGYCDLSVLTVLFHLKSLPFFFRVFFVCFFFFAFSSQIELLYPTVNIHAGDYLGSIDNVY